MVPGCRDSLYLVGLIDLRVYFHLLVQLPTRTRFSLGNRVASTLNFHAPSLAACRRRPGKTWKPSASDVEQTARPCRTSWWWMSCRQRTS